MPSPADPRGVAETWQTAPTALWGARAVGTVRTTGTGIGPYFDTHRAGRVVEPVKHERNHVVSGGESNL